MWPECRSLVDQVSIVSRSTQICGPSGSGMLLSAFSDAGCAVLDLESFARTVRQHARLYSSPAKTYGFCFGDLDPSDDSNPVWRRWSLPVDRILEAHSSIE